MGKSCTFIPRKRNSSEQSSLFKDLLKITNNDRSTTKVLWGLAQDDTFLQEKNLAVGEEPTAKALLNSFTTEELKSSLGTTGYTNYVEVSEGLDTYETSNANEAISKAQEVEYKHEDILPVVEQADTKYKVSLSPKTKESFTTRTKQKVLKEVNDKMISYMERLGFGVSVVNDLGSAGKFSPLEAKTNGENLIKIIQLSKGQLGQEALPEEFAHFVAEGFSNHPLFRRLDSLLNNEEVLKAALVDEFESYNELYKGDLNKIKKEVIAKLIAQHLVNREGLGDSIKYISDRFLNTVTSVFNKGDETYIEQLLNSIDETVQSIVDEMYSNEFIKYFDKNKLMKSPELHKIIKTGENLEELANKSLELMAKRLKILSLGKKDGKLSTEDSANFEKISTQIKKKEYSKSIISFLNYCLKDTNSTFDLLKRFDDALEKGEKYNLKAIAKNLRKVDVTLEAYSTVIAQLSAISNNKSVAKEISEEDIAEIEKLASEILVLMNNLKDVQKQMRFAVLFDFYKTYWGKDKIMKSIDGKETTITLENVLESTVGDTNFVGRFVNCMADMPDMFLQLVDLAYKDAAHKRDLAIFELQQRLANLQTNLQKETGSNDTKFMYVLDSKGVPTGMIISDIDYQKYYQEKHEYYEQLKQEGLDEGAITKKMKVWTRTHTEVIKKPNGYSERVPLKSMYKSDALNRLSTAQRKYYDAVMDIKDKLDGLLPQNRVHQHRAVQKRSGAAKAILQGKNLKSVFNNAKDAFISTNDDTEYGETDLDKGKYVVLDFAGNPVKKIPVYYTSWLDDMSALDTDFTGSLLSYGKMAFNKSSMDEIVDFMELSSAQMNDRKIKQTEAGKKLYARFKIGDKAFNSEYEKLGKDSELKKVLEYYINKNVYGEKKAVETTTIGNHTVNYGKILDSFRQYTSMVSLGFNWTSGTVNDTVGLLQIMFNSAGGEYTLKNLTKAHKEYIKMLPEYMMEQGSNIKKSKLYLLTQKFDVLEDYFAQLEDSEYYKGVFAKLITKISPMIPQSMGEHHLRCVGMMAILDNIKVIKNGKEMSLLDALEVKEEKSTDGYTIYSLSDGGAIINNEKLDDNYYFKLKLRIQEVNHKSLSNFSDVDKGELHKYVAGRYLAQFRQWMPKFYMERFKSSRYNSQTDKFEEGYYRTYMSFLTSCVVDAIHLKFNIMTKFSQLTIEQKRNIIKAFAESATLYLLGLLLKFAGEPEKEDPALIKYVNLVAKRTYTDIYAGIPSLEMAKSLTTIVKSPIAATRSLDNLLNLFDTDLMTEEITRGRFKGWTQWQKSAYYGIPFVRNYDKLKGMIVDGDLSLFLPYK